MKRYDHLKMSDSSLRPNPLAPTEEKETDDYGLKMAKLIEYEWFYIKSQGASNKYADKRLKFDKLKICQRRTLH